MALLCLAIGLLFLAASATSLGLVFITVGGVAEGLCLLLARTRCLNGVRKSQETAS
jgi:hypothetical protein